MTDYASCNIWIRCATGLIFLSNQYSTAIHLLLSCGWEMKPRDTGRWKA